MQILLAILLAGAPGNPAGDWGIIEPPATTESGQAVSACPVGSADDVVCYDNNGIVGGVRQSTTDPDGLIIRPQACAPSDGTCTAADLVLYGGQDTTTIAIDGADPSVSCADDNDTVTVTVYDNTGASTATVLTEGTEWTASASVADTCTSLASAVDALAGVSASCTSPNVLITLGPTTGSVVLAESTAGCTTVSVGTKGFIRLAGNQPQINFDEAGNDWMRYETATDLLRIVISGGEDFRLGANGLAITNGVYVGNATGTPQDNDIIVEGTITSTATGDLGWSIQTGADTACNTTCTSACVMGFADGGASSGSIVGCADATADSCLCAGSS